MELLDAAGWFNGATLLLLAIGIFAILLEKR
jgi:hypothetical protein